MDNELYEVTRDEYAGFLSQINKHSIETEVFEESNNTIIKVYSKTSKQHLCTRIVNDEQEFYYVFNMPPEEDRVPPQKIKRITLNTREEVEAFLNILSKLSKEDNFLLLSSFTLPGI